MSMEDLLGILDGEPARSLDLSLQDEEFKHALIGSKDALESVTSEVWWKRWLIGAVLNLEEFVLSMGNWHLEGVLSGHELTLESANILEPLSSESIKLYHHALLLELLLLFAK